MADSIGRIVDLGGRADTTGISYEIVSFSADTFSIDIFFIVITFGSTQSKVHDVSFITFTFLGDFAVGRMNWASITNSIFKLEVLR